MVWRLLCGGLVLLASARAAAADDLVRNGSFEEGAESIGEFASVTGSTAVSGWRVGSIDYIGTYWPAADGARSIDLNQLGPGFVEQELATVPGEVYTVRFKLAGNPYCQSDQVKTLRVEASGQRAEFSFSVAGHSLTAIGWVDRSWTFEASSARTALRFSSLTPGACGPALDKVAVEGVACEDATPTLYGPLPYRSRGDSPLSARDQRSFQLEDFEDGSPLDLEGVSASVGRMASAFGAALVDSVDGDDGTIDDRCTGCDAWWTAGRVTYAFDEDVLGGLPAEAGVVWTDGAGEVTFEAVGRCGSKWTIGPVSADAFPDRDHRGRSGEDRFFGIAVASGIRSITVSNSAGGCETDHLQFGAVTGSAAVGQKSSPLWPYLAALFALLLAALLLSRLGGRKPEPEGDEEEEEQSTLDLELVGLSYDPDRGAYALPADARMDGDDRPAAELIARVWKVEGGKRSPAPDGTAVSISVEGANRGVDEPNASAELRCDGQVRGSAVSLETRAGTVSAHILCGPATLGAQSFAAAPAERWFVDGEELALTAAAAFRIRAQALGAEGEARLAIVAGAPATLELLGPPESIGVPSEALPGPAGLPPVVGDELIAIDGIRFTLPTTVGDQQHVQRSARMLRLGGWLRSDPIQGSRDSDDAATVKLVSSSGEASTVPMVSVMLGALGVVRDSAGNPVSMGRGDNDGYRPRVRFPRWRGVGPVSHPFVLAAGSKTAEEGPWKLGASDWFPDSVFLMYLAPAYAPHGSAKTYIEVYGADREGGPGPWHLRVDAEPASEHAKLVSWFVSGDIPSKEYFLAEVLLGLVPFIGDGRDLLIYGLNAIHGERLTGIDHAVAVLSLAGLVLDIFPPAIAANAAAASAKAAVKTLRNIDDLPARQLADAISERVLKAKPDTEALEESGEMFASAQFRKFMDEIEELQHLADAVSRAKTLENAERLLTILGLTVAAIGLAPLLSLLGKRSYQEVVDILETLYELDKEGG